MSDAPKPVSSMRVYGQGLYRLRSAYTAGNHPDQHVLLFAVADEAQEYLAWYYFAGSEVIDAVLMQKGEKVDYDVVAKYAGHPTLFRPSQPMMIDELAGPILASRRGVWKAPKMAGAGFRRATIWMPDHRNEDRSAVHVHMTLNHDTGTYKIPINVKKSGRSGLASDFSERGWLNYVMTETFSYPSAHLDARAHINALRQKILQ